MADIKCYKIHTDLSLAKSLNTLIEKVVKIGNLVFDEDDYVIKEFYLANAPCLSYSLGSCVLVIAFDGELLLVSS